MARTPRYFECILISTLSSILVEATATTNLRATLEENKNTESIPAQPLTGRLEALSQSIYIFVGVCFIFALSSLGRPDTATAGNMAGGIAMLVALFTSALQPSFSSVSMEISAICLMIATLVGTVVARKAEMIQMPQLVASFHAMIGVAALMVAYANFYTTRGSVTSPLDKGLTLGYFETMVAVFFGSLTFSGSVVAALKLNGTIESTPMIIPFRHFVNAVLFVKYLFVSGLFMAHGFIGTLDLVVPENLIHMATFISMVLGCHLVMSIGGADMPVVVSMLNSYSGWTTAACGFMLNQNILIISGALIGSSGAILSYIMCRGMNRSFISVIIGGFGVADGTLVSAVGQHQETNINSLASTLLRAKLVVIVPGYGMAVSRCQQAMGGIAEVLRSIGCKVEFAIHPVAGRLPGHMNVLLAEANVPYDIVKEMEEINHRFDKCDVAIVCGANDIVNPIAEDPSSPIGGMPVLKVWEAKKCIIMKRSMATGYSGIDNPLFYKGNCEMLFGNAKERAEELLAALRVNSGGLSTNRVSMDNPLSRGLLEEEREIVHNKVAKSFPRPVKVVGVLDESEMDPNEKRVAITPLVVHKLRELGYDVVVQHGAGEKASFKDNSYASECCRLVSEATQVIQESDIILRIGKITENHVLKLKANQLLIGHLWPAINPELVNKLAERKVSSISVDAFPRITKAQKLDVLSSTANMAGYKAVIEAFNLLPRYSRALSTAAGKVPPATVFIVGAGVAGLSAIGTARSMGAVVIANDTRSASREQVESMGAEFVEVSYEESGEGLGGYAKEMSDEFATAQKRLYSKICRESDVIITTAQIPGKKPPLLITKQMIRTMKPGSVCVDLAAQQGGNIELTRKDEVFVDTISGVTLVGWTNLPARMASQASDLFAANMCNLFAHMGAAGNLESFLSNPDEVIKPAICSLNGEIVWRPQSPPMAPTTESSKTNTLVKPMNKPKNQSYVSQKNEKWISFISSLFLTGMLFVCIGYWSSTKVTSQVLTFVLSAIIGYFVVWNVNAALHTPLMSITNALSGVIVLGTVANLSSPNYTAQLCSILGTLCASVNICAGFAITHRMLGMFKR